MEVKLLMQHTRRGIVIPAGSVIDIPESKFAWFEKNGIAIKNKLVVPVEASITNEDEVVSLDTPTRGRGRKKRR